MRDPDTKAALLRAGRLIRDARKRAGLSQTELGERLGLSQSVVSDWERGELESWRDYVEALTRLLGVTPGYFAAATPSIRGPQVAPELEVVGEVQGGAFRLATEYSPEDRYSLPAIPSPGYERVPRRYLKVVGDSVNELFPDGTFVCVVSSCDTDVRAGDIVVVYSRQGELREATIKQLDVEPDGRVVLRPRSNHPDHQAPIYLADEDQDGPEIAYVVIGAYTPVSRPPSPIRFTPRRS